MPGSYPIMTPFNNPLIRFISEKKFRWLRHTLFILVGLILAYKGDIGTQGDFASEKIRNAVLFVDTVSFLFILSMIYLLMLVLIPYLLFRSKVFLFSISFFSVLSLIYLVVWYLDYRFLRPLNPGRMVHIEFSLLTFVQIGA